MNKKNLFVITLSFLLALSMSVVAFAEDLEPPVEPGDDPSPYEYIQRASASCSISGGTATCGVNVSGKTGVTRITTTLSLQRKISGGSWTTVKTWPTKTVYTNTLTDSKTTSVSSGYIYRTKATGRVYQGASSEPYTVYSGSVSY